MARTKTKSGSKVKAPCPICGKVLTKAGLVGHMRWTHKRDIKAPLLRVEHPLTEARQKLKAWDMTSPVHKLFCRMFPLKPISGDEQAALANAYLAEHNLSKAELLNQLQEQRRENEEMLELIRSCSRQRQE